MRSAASLSSGAEAWEEERVWRCLKKDVSVAAARRSSPSLRRRLSRALPHASASRIRSVCATCEVVGHSSSSD